jgi:hypothetical protein
MREYDPPRLTRDQCSPDGLYPCYGGSQRESWRGLHGLPQADPVFTPQPAALSRFATACTSVFTLRRRRQNAKPSLLNSSCLSCANLPKRHHQRTCSRGHNTIFGEAPAARERPNGDENSACPVHLPPPGGCRVLCFVSVASIRSCSHQNRYPHEDLLARSVQSAAGCRRKLLSEELLSEESSRRSP